MLCPYCKKQIPKRSLNENNYFHGVILTLLSEHTGHTAEELKFILKKKFGWMETKQILGELVEIPISSANMTVAQFEQFMSQIRMFGDTIGVYLPEPNENERTKES